jgi:hypothetical protein
MRFTNPIEAQQKKKQNSIHHKFNKNERVLKIMRFDGGAYVSRPADFCALPIELRD